VRAGVNVATVYRHFPDKFAVVRALAMRLESERVERAVGLIDGLGTAADWRDAVTRIVTAVMFARRTQPGALAVRRALQASPSLQDIERDATERLVEALATALLRRRPSLGQPRARVLSTSVVVAAGALLDHAWDRPDPDDALVEEAAAMAIRYLAPDLA
jgi:AcrR family transcriptional regulator